MTIRRKLDGNIYAGTCYKSRQGPTGLEPDCDAVTIQINHESGSASVIAAPLTCRERDEMDKRLKANNCTVDSPPSGIYSSEALQKICKMYEEDFKLNGRFEYESYDMPCEKVREWQEFFSDRLIIDNGEMRTISELLSELMSHDIESNVAFYVGMDELLIVDEVRERQREMGELDRLVYVTGDQIVCYESDELLMKIIYGKWIEGNFHRAKDQHARLPTITQTKTCTNKNDGYKIKIPKCFKLYSIEYIISFLEKKNEFYAISGKDCKHFQVEELKSRLNQCLTQERLENNLYYLDSRGFSPVRYGGYMNIFEDA